MINPGDDVTIFHLWTVAAVVLGFQMAALAWRMNRELYAEKKRAWTWIPWADRMIYVSMIILIGGVFIAPLVGDVSLRWAVWLFGLALVIFAATPPVIAGHYNVFRYDPDRIDRPPTTTQEKWALGVVSVAIGAYFVIGLVLLL